MGKPSTKAKGMILEDLVAALHRLPSMRVDTRIRLPSVRPNSKRKREVDVLLTAEVMGYPVRIAFSCKNERRLVKTSQVDEFIAALDDVGIPRSLGVIVTPLGFTSDALRMTEENGIRPLIFEGLNDSRVAAAVSTAMQSVIYLACVWRDIQYFDCASQQSVDRPPSWCSIASDAQVPVSQGDLKLLTPHLLHHVWKLWGDGKIPRSIGKQSLFLRLESTAPAEAVGQRGVAFVEVQVIALIAQLDGTLTDARLKHARTQEVEKRRIDVSFRKPPVDTIWSASFPQRRSSA